MPRTKESPEAFFLSSTDLLVLDLEFCGDVGDDVGALSSQPEAAAQAVSRQECDCEGDNHDGAAGDQQAGNGGSRVGACANGAFNEHVKRGRWSCVEEVQDNAMDRAGGTAQFSSTTSRSRGGSASKCEQRCNVTA